MMKPADSRSGTNRHHVVRAVALALILLVSLGSVSPADAMQAATYYVSAGGDDNAAGTTPSEPWRTLERVNQVDLGPGDQVLLAGGETHTG